MNPEQLVAHGEEPNEMGGYFICNGLEKLIRLLIVPRSNNVCFYYCLTFLLYLFILLLYI